VDFAFTEEQRAIRDVARAFLGERADHAHLRMPLASPTGWDEAIWPSIASELGWTGIAIPEAFGGSGLGAVELAILLEETGRVLLAAPFFETAVLATQAIQSAATHEQQAALLAPIAAGKTRATLAFTGREGRPAPDGIAMRLDKTAGGWRLSGDAHYVPFGHAADLLIVAARTDRSEGTDGVSLVALEPQRAGLSIERVASMDLTRPYAKLRMDSVAVGKDDILGEPEAAGPALVRTLAIASGLLAAEQTGGAEQCLESTVAYAKQRMQFGRAIGSFQAVKHRLADMMMLVESAKSAAWYAAAAIAEDDPELFEAASIARAYCSDAYSHCAGEAIQLHGGIGFTWEHSAPLYFKRARASATLLGDPAYHREAVARRMGLDVPLNAQDLP
jgi:alkylation response protein AidB-like acyl-CoA dehydrogenase